MLGVELATGCAGYIVDDGMNGAKDEVDGSGDDIGVAKVEMSSLITFRLLLLEATGCILGTREVLRPFQHCDMAIEPIFCAFV
jgi:hypothetical protein